MNIKNLKVGARLGLGFGVVICLLGFIAVLSIIKLAQIQARMQDIAKVNDVKARLAVNMRVTVLYRAVALRNMLILGDAEEIRREDERIKRNADRYAESQGKLAAMFSDIPATTTEEKVLLRTAAASSDAALRIMSRISALVLADKKTEAAEVLLKEMHPVQMRWMATLNDLVSLEQKQNDAAADEADGAYRFARNVIITLSTTAILFGISIAWTITKGITRPINHAVRIAQTVAAGDLSSRIEVKTSDETGKLLSALNDMNESLVRIVSGVRTGADTIAAASAQIANGNLDLSARTEQQASSHEEIASSSDDLTATVKHYAYNARQANGLASSASDVARQGGEIVTLVIDTMGSINESAKKIANIISVIDGIAFQTNILALNAAVEAARAGEQGRGFAVVAAEVRNLAQRSAAAAREIKVLIGDSVEKVACGSKLVDQAGATMAEIVDSVRRVTDIMAEITAASDEQRVGIEQVNQAIGQMDETTQQNAALVEQAAAAAQALQEQAGKLAQTVGVFRLADAQATEIVQVAIA